MTKPLESIAQIGARLRKNDRPIGEEALYAAVKAKRFEVFRAGRYSYSTYDAVREWYDKEYAPPHPELIPTHPVAEPSSPKQDAMIAALTDNTEAIRALTRSVARLSALRVPPVKSQD